MSINMFGTTMTREDYRLITYTLRELYLDNVEEDGDGWLPVHPIDVWDIFRRARDNLDYELVEGYLCHPNKHVVCHLSEVDEDSNALSLGCWRVSLNADRIRLRIAPQLTITIRFEYEGGVVTELYLS